MPTVLAQSNLPKSAAVVVSSETIILRDPNNSILEKYTSDQQKQKSLKSYGIKPETMLSPGENKIDPRPQPPIVVPDFDYTDGNEILPLILNPPFGVEEITTNITAGEGVNAETLVWVGQVTAEALTSSNRVNRFATNLIMVEPGMYISFDSIRNTSSQPTAVFFDEIEAPLLPSECIYGASVSNQVVPDGARYVKFQTSTLSLDMRIRGSHTASLFGFSNINNQNLDENG